MEDGRRKLRWWAVPDHRAVGPTKPVGQMVRHSKRVWRRTGHCTTNARQVFARHQNSSLFPRDGYLRAKDCFHYILIVHGRIFLPRFLPSLLSSFLLFPLLLNKNPWICQNCINGCYSANTAPMKSNSGSLESSRAALRLRWVSRRIKDSLLGNTLKKIQEK